MADDKGGGGEGGWDLGPIEVLVGILLIIGVLDHISGRPNNTKQATQSAAPVTVEDINGSICGLSIVRPRPNEKILNTINIAGSAGDCDWRVTKDVAVYAQVVDSKGKPVSGYIAVPPTRSYDTGAWFESTIALTGKPALGTGYLILVPAVQTPGAQTISTRIPLKF